MYSLQSFEEKANSLTSDRIKILEFNGVKLPVTFECLACHQIQKVNKGETLVRKGKLYQCQYCHYTKERATLAVKHKIENLCEKVGKKLVSFERVGLAAKFECLKCGSEFSREPLRFLKTQNCPICESRCVAVPLKQFKKELKVFAPEYEIVDETQYSNLHTKILVRHNCGFIYSTKPSYLLHEKSHCPKCSRRVPQGEKKITKWLDMNQIIYTPQWSQLIQGHLLFFDFFLPKHKLLIEFQGAQHYESVAWFGGDAAFEIRQQYDQYKREWAQEQGYTLLEISYRDFARIEEILEAQRLK